MPVPDGLKLPLASSFNALRNTIEIRNSEGDLVAEAVPHSREFADYIATAANNREKLVALLGRADHALWCSNRHERLREDIEAALAPLALKPDPPPKIITMAEKLAEISATLGKANQIMSDAQRENAEARTELARMREEMNREVATE